jgi:hypothetical protein
MQLKNVVIAGMITALLIPFILLTDIYPFFRFGMFAEKVRYSHQMETFAIRYTDIQGQIQLMQEEQLGLPGFSYLLRNYYYRNQSKELLKHIHQAYTGKEGVVEWQLLRINSTTQPPFRSDTVVVENLVLNKNSL